MRVLENHETHHSSILVTSCDPILCDCCTEVKSRLAFTASSDASMEVVIKQHNPLGKGAGDETNDS